MSRSLSHFFGDNVLLGSRARKPVKQFEVVEEPKKTTKNNTNAKKKNGGNKENKSPNEDDSYYSDDEESYEEPVAKKSGRRSDGPKRVPKKSMRYVPDSEDDESDGMDSIESDEPEEEGSGKNEEGEDESEEETAKIDAILGYKPSKDGKPADDQFLIKFQGESYLHVKWLNTAEVEEYPAGKQRIKRYLAKRKQMEENGELDEDEEYFDPNFAIIERIIAVDYFADEDEESDEEKENGGTVEKMQIDSEGSGPVEEKADKNNQKGKVTQKKGSKKQADDEEDEGDSKEESGPLELLSEESQENGKSGKKHYFVKFKSLQYDEATWEDAEMVEREYPELVEEFEKRIKLPTKELQQNSKKGAVRRNTKDFKEDMEQTKFESDITLREYQLEGLRWLVWNWCCGRSGILGDEMGLGKTVQALSILWWLRVTKKMRGPFLIICPLATIDHWLHHVNSLTSFNAIVWHGTQTSRDLIHENEFYFDGLSKTMAKTNNVYKFEVILTTFEVLLQDVELLSKPFWKYLVIDEAHRLKNKQSRLFEILQSFRSEHRLLLTGTPLQNNIDELWTMLNFIDPDEFSSFQDFSKKYGALQTSKQVQKLQKELSPYLLRRMKNDVEKSIPSKEETIVDVELTYTQKKFYRAVLEKNRNFLSMGASNKSNVPSLSNIMMELRKVCNHPYLVAAAEETITRDVKSDKEHKEWLVKSSAKLVFLDKLLPKLQAEGHKVLIFSQMVRMLDLLEDYMNYKAFKFERIDGSMDRQSRAQSLTRFKTIPDRFVMLLSTKACSLGIDLTVADTVVLFDSDWNPHSDLQAQARSHRIGQKNKVKVFRLVTRNTYESQMFQVASRKLGLNRAVLGNSEFGGKNDSKPDAFLDAKDIERLLKVGAYDLFKADAESEKQLQDQMFNEDIETILSRSKTVTVDENGGGSNQGELFASFSKASFVASNKDMDVAMDAQDFWEKILPEFKDAASLLKKLKKGELTSPESKDAFLNDIESLIKTVKEAARHRSQFSSQNPATEVADLLIKSEISGVFDDAQVTRIIIMREDLEGRRARKKDGKAGGDAMEVDEGEGEKKAKPKPAPKTAGSEWTKKSFQELRKALLLYPFGEWESIINQSKELSKNFSLEDIQCYSEQVASYVCSPDQLANCERERVEDKEAKDEKGNDTKPTKKSSKKRSVEEDDHPFLLNYLEYQTKLLEADTTEAIPYKAIISKCTVGKKLNPGQRFTFELEWRAIEKPTVNVIAINRQPCDYDQETRQVRLRGLTDPKVKSVTMYAPGYIGSYSISYDDEKVAEFSVIENRVMSRDFDEQMKQFKTWNRRFNFLLKLQKIFDKFGANLENLKSFVIAGSAPAFWWGVQQDKLLLQHTRASGFSRYTSLQEELNNIDKEYLRKKVDDTLSEKHRMHTQSEELRKVASPNLRVDLPSYADYIKRDEAKQAVKFEVPASSVLTTRLTKVVKVLSEEKANSSGSAMEVVMTINKKRKIDEIVQAEKAEKENKPKKKQKVNAEDTAGGESKTKKETKSKPKDKKEPEQKQKVKKEVEKETKKKGESATKGKKEPKKDSNGSPDKSSKPQKKEKSTKSKDKNADNKKITSFFTKENGDKKENGSAEKKKQPAKEKKPTKAEPLLLVLDE